MRYAILTMLLAVVSAEAAAEWIDVGRNETATTYADPATVQKTDDMAQMWDLVDFKAVQARPYGTPYMSQKTQQEYDCKEGRARVIHFLRYPENMGGGEVVNTETDPQEWKPVPPGSTVESLWKLACKR